MRVAIVGMLLTAGGCTCQSPPPASTWKFGERAPFAAEATAQADGTIKVVFTGPAAAPKVNVTFSNRELPVDLTATADGAGWSVVLGDLPDSGSAVLAVEVAGGGFVFQELAWATMLDVETEVFSADGAFSIRLAAGQLPAGQKVALSYVAAGVAADVVAGPYHVLAPSPLTAVGRFSASPESEAQEGTPLAQVAVSRAAGLGQPKATVTSVLHPQLRLVTFTAELPGIFALVRSP